MNNISEKTNGVVSVNDIEDVIDWLAHDRKALKRFFGVVQPERCVVCFRGHSKRLQVRLRLQISYYIIRICC